VDLVATPEHEALRAVVARLAMETMQAHQFAEFLDDSGGPRADPSLWSRLAQLGLIGLSVPERLGGAGAGLLEETILFEELGAALLPVPLFSTVALCLPLLTAAPDAAELVLPVVEGNRRYALAAAGNQGLSLLAEDNGRISVHVGGPSGGPVLTGSRSWVLDAVGADGFLVPVATPDGPMVYLVETGAVAAVKRLPTVDASSPAFELEFSASPARLILGPDQAAEALAAMRRTGIVLASAEAVGISRRMLATTVGYAATRTQFGRPIAAYQAVSHQLADTYVDVELARSLLLWAALEPVDTVVVAAASRVLPSAVRACERAIQLHGGIGMTWEAPMHRYYKRALLLHALVPRPGSLREVLAQALLDA
jgi:alkylation response protein AidB-like acyl-CoA dehydrogenase